MDALRAKLVADHPDAKRIGVLTSDYVREKNLFGRAFQGSHAVIYPDADAQRDLMEAVYAAGGIKAGRNTPELLGKLQEVCAGLIDSGCDVIIPGFTELSLVHAALASSVTVPIINATSVTQILLSISRPTGRANRSRLAWWVELARYTTVDFMSKVVRLTEAARDQDHIKMIVEQNPQIPDRTEHLVRSGTDPTIAMFATCKKLEAAEADLIAIPCNTAHAFVDRMQAHLRVPVLNMLDETMAQVAGLYSGQLVGLLATSGTIESGVYAEAAERAGVKIIVPDAAHQLLVMEAIYGATGVKAGFTEGKCREDLRKAIIRLAQGGAGVVMLGSTELPLLFPQTSEFDADGSTIALLDPTMLLAAACVRHAQAARTPASSAGA